MKAETWVAIYAAIIGTSAFLLNLKTWFDSGVKLKLRLVPDGMTILYVTNRGDAATMITNMVLLEIGSWWRLMLFNLTSSVSWWRWKVQPERSYEIANPQLKGCPRNVPSTLEPSKRWTGAIRQRPDVIPNIHTGDFYTGIYASNRDHPYLVRIPKRQDKLPEGTTTLG